MTKLLQINERMYLNINSIEKICIVDRAKIHRKGHDKLEDAKKIIEFDYKNRFKNCSFA